MDLVVVSNVGEWSAFFSTLLELHQQRRGSAFNKKNVVWPINLVNTAVSRDKNGRLFPYYEVADKGRAAIGGLRGSSPQRIAFADRIPELTKRKLVHTNRVRGTTGFSITARSLAQIQPRFTPEVAKIFDKWLNTANEKALLAEGVVGKASKKGFRVKVARLRNRKAVLPGLRLGKEKKAKADFGGFQDESGKTLTPEQLEALADKLLADLEDKQEDEEVDVVVADNAEAVLASLRQRQIRRAGDRAAKKKENSYKKFVAKLATKSRREFDDKEFLRKAEAARAKAGFKEAQRIALLVSNLQSQRALAPIGVAAGAQARLDARAKARDRLALRGEAALGKRHKQPDVVSADNLAIKQFIKIPNWVGLAAIFARVTGEQIETVWKPNTPVRATFKLGYLEGGKQVRLNRTSGGKLRNAYTLITNKALADLAK